MAVTLEDKQAQERGQRVAESPLTYTGGIAEVERFGTKLEEVSPVSEMKQTAEEKMRSLFEFDKKLEGEYDPLAGKRAEMYPGAAGHPLDIYRPASQYVAGGAGDISDLFKAIGAYKSLEGTALTQALSTVFGFLQMQEETRRWEQEMALKEKEAGLPTEKEKAQALLDEIADAARNYTNLETLVQRYGTQVDPGEILRLYNTYSPFGVAREKPEELYSRYGIVPPTGAPKIAAQDEGQKIGAMIKTMINEFETIPANQKGPGIGTITSRLGFAFPQAAEYEEARRGFSGALKKLVGETGVLTDYDIQRITGVLPATTDVPEQSRIAKNRLNTIFKEVYGVDLFGGEGEWEVVK